MGSGVMTRIGFVRRAMLAELPHWARFLWAVLAVAIPTLLRVAIDNGTNGVPFVTYFPAIMLAAVFLDWRYAAAVAIGSAIVAKRLFIGGALVTEMDLANLLITGMFFLSCALLIVIGATLRRTLRQLEDGARAEQLLAEELRHRVKNVLAVVLALSSMSRRGDPANAWEDFSGRLNALAAATDLVGAPGAGTCRMPDLVREAVKPFASGGNIAFAGPECRLPSECCVPTMLALHELCTNAMKHGALSTSGGSVMVEWALTDAGSLTIDWREEGGPPVEAPKRKGMGTRLLVRQPGLDEVALRFDREGVKCRLRIERAEPVEPAD